jgi:hypothetical protein
MWVHMEAVLVGPIGTVLASPRRRPVAGGSAGRVVAGAGCAEEAGKRRDCLLQQRVDAGLLVGSAAGAEFGDGAAVLVLGGELSRPGRDGRDQVGHRSAGRGVVSRG